ncbi:hemocytin [Ixodes scapularis]|uniref:hemocytin n=1 Tax=Ixodes scapularis TaxID=6945 RepID=UPI001C38FD45|nr:hemocytin [Ixodes scapularis]
MGLSDIFLSRFLQPGEVFEKECEKCQCAHNEVSCLHLEGCGTEAPQETTTYTPEPEGGCWTPWFSTDSPEGPGDFEDLRPMQAHGKVCLQPAAINCRTVAGNTDWSQSGQKVTCAVDRGLQCWNSENSPEQCQDYEVRFYCPCEETPTPVPWTPVPEPHCEHGWSSWLNGHSLDALGDLETLQSARDTGLLQCPSVTAMECREADSQVSWDQSGLVGVQCDLTTGLVCRNKGQPKGRSCADFEVRFFCDCGGETPPPPPTLPPATPTPAILVETTPPACSFWSDWVDENHPGLEGQDGEREPGLNLRPELGDFCQEGSVTEAECAESSSGRPYEEAGQTALHCDVNEGYTCRDQDQPAGRCIDIKIRFFCSCEEVSPTTMVIVTPKPTPHPGCSEFIRLIDGPEPLKDSLLKASSSRDSKSGPQASRFSSDGSWVPHLNDKEFIEAELVRPQTVYGVETRGDSQLGAWVTSFTVMFSQDGVAYGQLSNTDGSPKVFSGNHDAQSKNRQLFEHPFQAKFIRLVPKSWEGRIALKWDLLGCSYETFTPKPIGTPSNMEVCREPMGLQSGLIGDNQMEASSYRDEEHAAHYGRVEQRGWVAGVADKQQYLQVDFEDSRNLTAVVTQGRPEIPQWVKSFIVQTSNNGKRWNTIKDKEGGEMVFSGNFDSSTPVTSVFPKTVSARYLRIVPLTWKNWIALRLEVLGCEHEEGTTTPGPTTAAPIVVPGFKCPEPNGLFPDPINCRMFYHCSNDEPHHKWCPGDLHFNPKLLVCDWKQNAGCEEGFISEQPKTTPEPVVTLPPEPCVAYGPWVSTTDPGLESEGDVEDIRRIIDESDMCREPMGIECREYATDADYRSTGQRVTCDLEHGLRCLNHEQDSRPCLNYKVRVKCWTCRALEESTPTPELTAVHCPEVSGENATSCGQGCPVGFACDGLRCVHEADCPCVRDGKHFPVGGILETRTCQECQCQLGGRSNCLPIACPACPEGRAKILNPDCSCDCGGCPEGQRLCPTSGECVNEDLWCDGVVNCPDDEAQCEAKTPAPCPPVAKVFCGKGQTMTLQTDDQGCEHFSCESGERPIIVPPPPTKASCELVGHHFSTFDGREFDYSYCHHILLQDVVGGNLTISVDRHCSLENQESCPKRVIVEHGHHRIVLDADLSATVDGDEYSAHQLQLLTKRLPDFELERVGERIHFRSRVHNLVLKLDVRGRVEIEVDSSLKGVLGGLCGFYNELVSDDLTTPAGHQVATSDEFGDSWATPGTAQDCLPLACPKDTLLQAAKICNRLKEEPLSQCQGIEDQLENCLSASCECLQRGNTTAESCACDAYLDAVTQCEKDGGEKAVESLRGWRLEYGCVPDCPPEMEWLDCGPDCQITCENFLAGDLGCATKKSCNPGCFCPPGTVLDRDHCKKADECADKVCTGYGDPMIETFDGWKFHVQSNGHFELVFDREGRFMVDAVTDSCEERATCIIGLDIKHENHVAKIRRHKQVLIDNEEYDRDQLPWTGMGVTIFAMPGKVTVVVFTGLGVQIRYNEISAAFSIHVPSKTFFNKTAGLCGNCNGKPDDDKTTKNGTITEEMVTFVCSWETHISEEECVRNFTGEEPEKPPVPGACSEILDREVFGQCLSLVDTTKFVDQCRHDTSFSVQENTAVCSSLLEMARACCLADVEVDNSWIQKFCNITCPGDTRYMSCHDACPQSCDTERENEASSKFVKGSSKTHYHKSDCRNLKVDGCFCPDGQVFEDGDCKPKDVCDLCDDQGHKLGDVWKTDQCTSCTCKKDGKMDCQHEVCPPDPICRENQKLVRVSGAELEQCCDKNYCQDIVEECPELSLPRCERGDVTRTKTDSKGCPMYYCECDPALCPPVVWPTDLEPGQEVEMTPVGCCATLHAVCRPEKCPQPPHCAPPLELLETPGVCCRSFKCRPPEKVCPYAHKFVVVDGKEVAIEPALQNVSFYEPGQTWRDGLCSNCSCDESGTDLMARCNLERCYESAELPDDKDYFLSIVDVPNRCCPALVRLFCKDEYGNIREPGDEWQSRDDQCKSHICEQTALGEVHKVERSIICPKCPENAQALPLGPGECCPRCQIVACEEAGVMHPVGSHWNSSSHLCYRAECVQAGDTARIVYTSPSCAPVSKKCPKDQVVWDANRCCQTCNVTIVSEEACAPLPLNDRESVRMFRFEHERWGLCTNPRPVTGARECAGTCESHSLFTTGNSNDVTANCKCCNPTQWELRKIQLTCRNGKTLTKTFRQPTACHCTPCANEVGQREVEIMKEENNGGVKVPFSKQNTKYTTLQGDQPPEDRNEKLEPISQMVEEPYTHVEVTNKPSNQEQISQVVQEPYNPEEASDKPNKPEPISQIVQQPYNPEEFTEKPGKPEPISQNVQEPYNPEEVTEMPNKPEPINQIVQEPYNPEDVNEKPGKPEPVSQIVQEPYNPEEVTEKPGKPEPISQIVQEPYSPEEFTEKPGKPEHISQIVQEPYNPEEVTEKPGKPEPISQIVQEPYNPEEVTEKPDEPESISQIVQEPYKPEEVTESPGKPEPISQIVQEPYNPEEITAKPGKPEPISQIVQEPYNPEEETEKPEATNQIVQEPYNPEEVTENPGKPEPISQIVQEPYNPEEVTEKPGKPEAINQIVQEPYNPEEVTDKPGKPEPISQIVQEPYNPEEVTEKPGKPEPISQIVQEPYNPEDVTEKPGKPEPISQIVQEPYNPEDVTENPAKRKPISQIVQEPYNPEEVTEKPARPEPISQIVQEPYNPEEVTDKPGKPEPISQIVQEPYNPEEVTEKPGKPEPISQIVQEPYNPEDVTEKPGKPEPISQVVQEPYNPEDVTEKPAKPQPISQIIQEPYNPEEVTEKPGKPEAISQIVQEPYNPEEVTEKPGKPEPISQIVQEPYNPEDVTEEPVKPESISQIVQEPYNPEEVTEKPGMPEPISQIVQEPYNPEVTEKPARPEPISQIIQEPYSPEEVTEKPGKPEHISQIAQEPYNPEEVTDKPGKPEPMSQIVQEPYNPEEVTEKPGKPEPISPIVQEPYNPEEVTVKPNMPEPTSQVVQEPYNPEEVTEKPSKQEPISQIVQEPYHTEETGSPGKLEPTSHVVQEPYRPDDVENPVNHIVQEPYTPGAMEQQPYHPDNIEQFPYQPEEIPNAEIQGPLNHIAQEPYHPDDITEPHVEQRPYEPEHAGQYPYRPEDVPDLEPKQPAGHIVQEPYHPEDIPEPHVEQRPYYPEHTGQSPYSPEDIVQAPYHPEDVEHSLHESSHTDDDTVVPEWMWRNAPLP